ncbi:MAG: FtsQ-type POTRA domain-containing protein [Actinomycetaceae bacterium]|nr:FtsQ-type POTRA domain-containing protein [Actinomycetaceae bacterium]
MKRGEAPQRRPDKRRKHAVGYSGTQSEDRVDKRVARGGTTRVTIGTRRRYFTPKKAIETFGAAETNELAQRRDELKKAKSRAIWNRILLTFGVLALIGAGVWMIFFSSVFVLKADEIEVRGSDSEVPVSEVVERIEPWVGTPLPRASIAQMEAEVEEIVSVRQAHIEREWPNGVTVDIEMRIATMAEKRSNKWVLMDPEGVELSEVTDRPDGIPTIEITVDKTGDRSQAIVMANTVLGELDSALIDQVDAFVSDGYALEMRTVNGALIKWGDETQSDLKSRTVLVLLEQRPSSVYDVSTPTRPVTS